MKTFGILTLLMPCVLLADWIDFGHTTSIKPTEVQTYRLTYKFNRHELRSGQTLELELPENFKAGMIDFVYLTHKQDPRDEHECYSRREGSVIWDCLPGYTSFEILAEHPENRRIIDDWRYWGGVGSGPFNSKFAEIREGWGETDNLYEWARHGHHSVATKEKSYTPLVPLKFRVRSVGPDSILLQEVVIKFVPPAPKFMNQIVFADGLDFGAFDTAVGRRYPGRAAYGDYGNSLDLSPHYSPRHKILQREWFVAPGELHIPMTMEDPLSFIDVACGDMKRVPYGADAENYRGGSHFSIFVVRPDGQKEALMWKENIGTNGVMRVTLDPKHKPIVKGDVLIFKATEDTAHVMGIRFGFR